jgi:hypothetical protein
MTTILFWNLNGKPLQAAAARLAERHKLDLLLLAECALAPEEMSQTLSARSAGAFHCRRLIPGREFYAYSRFDPAACFGPVLEEADHYSIRPLTVPGGIDVLLAVAHLPILFKEDKDRRTICTGFGNSIREAERKARHHRTLVVGDLNVNPYHDGMLDVRGLHAIADLETVRRRDPRILDRVRREEYHFFYNPMWSHFGDAVRPCGTYYYEKANREVDPLWNIFDQVLLRRELADRFKNEDLRILTGDGQIEFLRRDGRPNAAAASDHLPIVFTVDLRRQRGLP